MRKYVSESESRCAQVNSDNTCDRVCNGFCFPLYQYGGRVSKQNHVTVTSSRPLKYSLKLHITCKYYYLISIIVDIHSITVIVNKCK